MFRIKRNRLIHFYLKFKLLLMPKVPICSDNTWDRPRVLRNSFSTPIRWISVDDTDTDLQYISNSWFADNGSLDAIGNNGPPFLSTLHGTNSSGASFTFGFSGVGLRVMGTYTGTQNTSRMDWNCFVDGISLGKTSPSAFYQNHRMLCMVNPMTDGPHTVTVNATTVGENQTFWFDKIQYLPSASVSLENKTIQLDKTDPAILYGSGWSTYSTQTNGAQVGCNFYGVSVSWYGTEISGNSTRGTWSIDNNPSTTFTMNGRGTNDTPSQNEKYFQTPRFTMGSHRLIITYNGDNSTTPLNLGYLVVQNGTLLGSTGSMGPSSTQPANTATATGSSSTHTGAILGGALGGAACLLVVVVVLFYRHRRRTRRATIDLSMGMASPSRSYQTEQLPPVVFHPDSHVSSTTGGQGGVTPTLQLFQDPSGPRKLQNETGNLPGVASGPIRPQSGFVSSQDGGVLLRPVNQELPRVLIDAPPAYSPDY